MALGFDNFKSAKSEQYQLTCSCSPDRPDWFDAGCVFHGIKSMSGQFDGEQVFDNFRRAVLGTNRPTRWT